MELSLFETDTNRPLAERLRPKLLADVVGQEHLLASGQLLRQAISNNALPSIIFWGPPGSGKTTMAKLLAAEIDANFHMASAVQSGTADLKKLFEQIRGQNMSGKKSILFIDEIHRFNRAQQDILLPVVESGLFTLIGATTENPSFELNSALLSRTQVLVLKRLEEAALEELIKRAEAETDRPLPLTAEARNKLIHMADGDGRSLLNMVETLYHHQGDPLDVAQLSAFIQRRAPVYDKSQEGHYNLMSALHKSLRGSDVQAGLYWFARMLDGGEDPLYIIRRLIRFASEDIGMADPNALTQALAARDAYQQLGSPEGELAIAQAVVYLATAPKSNAQYKAFKLAMKSAAEHGSLSPPAHILNAPTSLMKDLGYGSGYQYDHDTAHGFSGQNYFPDGMGRETYYTPKEVGFERDIKKRLDYWEKLRQG